MRHPTRNASTKLQALALLVGVAVCCGCRAKTQTTPADQPVHEVTACKPAEVAGSAAASPPRQVLQGSVAGDSLLAFSPNGERLALAGGGDVRIWDVEHGVELRRFRRADITVEYPVGELAWLDERRLVFGGGETPPYVVDVNSGHDLGRWPESARIRIEYPLGHGRLLGSRRLGVDRELLVIDGATAAVDRIIAPKWSHDSSLSPEGDSTAVRVSGSNEVQIFSTSNDAPPRRLTLPDGTLAWALGARGRLVTVGEAPYHDVAPPRGTKQDSHVFLTISPDGRRGAAYSDTSLSIADLADKRAFWSRESPSREYRSLMFSPSSQSLAIVYAFGAAELRDARTGRLTGELGRPPPQIIDGEFFGDGMVTLSADTLAVWSFVSAEQTARYSIDGVAKLDSVDDDIAVLRIAGTPRCASDQIGVWAEYRIGPRLESAVLPLADGRPLEPMCLARDELLLRPEMRAAGAWYAAAHDFDGTLRLALVDTPSGIEVLDLQHARRIYLSQSDNTFESCGFSPEGTLTACGGWARMPPTIWETISGRPLTTLGEAEDMLVDDEDAFGDALRAGVTRVAFGPTTHKIAFSSDRGKVRLLETSQSDTTVRAIGGVDGGVSALTVDDDGTVFVGTDAGELHSIRPGGTWSAWTGAPEGSGVRAVRLDGVGSRVITLGEDKTIRLWDSSTRRMLATFTDFTDGEWLIAAPDGTYTGTSEVAERIGWVFEDPLEHFRFEQFVAFREPAGVAAQLRGADPPQKRTVLRPPRVDIKRATVTDASAKVLIKANSATRVDRVRVFVEGREAANEAVCAANAEVEVNVPLVSGRNRVTVIAYGADGASSNTRSVNIQGPAGTPRPDIWVVAVGVSAYPGLPPEQQLRYADDDAAALAERLGRLAGEGRIYERSHVTLLRDTQVTTDSVLAALDAFAGMRATDLAVVFLSGHGVKRDTNGEMVFLTSQASVGAASVYEGAIDWAAIGDRLGRARGRVIVLLDACHAGHLDRATVVPNDALAQELGLAGRSGVIVFAASKGRQVSFEPGGVRAVSITTLKGPHATQPHGLFTGAVLSSLQDAETDSDNGGTIDVDELIDAVTRQVSSATRFQQTPWVVRREIPGDFAIADVRKVP